VAFPRNIPVEVERKNTSKLSPVLSGKGTIKALAKVGFVPVRQKGSHVFLRHVDGRRTVVPLHEEVNKSTIMDIIEQTKLTRQGFLKLIK
jgi:predicted RNA binding protein YcfA (HicA-like mRNA interferase family)